MNNDYEGMYVVVTGIMSMLIVHGMRVLVTIATVVMIVTVLVVTVE